MLRKMKPGQPGTKQLTEQYGEQLLWLRIGFVDRAQQQQLRAAGGKWDSRRCVWSIRYDAAVKLGYATNVERREVSL